MPPVPTTSSSSYLSAITSPTTAQLWRRFLAECGFERRFPRGERLVHLRVAQHEGREDADAIRVDAGLEKEQALRRGRLGDRRREIGRRFLRLRILDQLDREHHPEPAYIPDLAIAPL